MKRLDEITIADLMPDSISKDAEVSATSRAIDPQLKAVSEAVDKPLILAAIDDLSEGVLEHLAVQYDVTAWNSAWPIETKQAVLKTAIADKRKMGTRGAVQRAIEAVAPIATITEWWQDTSGDMPPHTFEIDLLQEGAAVDAETQASVIAQVNEAKPVRSHFTFSVGQMLGGNVYFAGVLRSIAYARVRSAGISIEQMGIEAGILAAMRGMSIRRLLTSSHMGEMPEPTPPDTHPSYIVVDSTTGIIIHSIEDEGMVYGEVGYGLMNDEGMVYGDVGYVLMDEAAQMITVYETGVRVESFYFTTNGRNETQNTNISHSDIPVYFEDGTAPAADTPYNGSAVMAFMDVNGNTKQADGESLYLDDGVLRLDAPDTDEGEQWAALVEEIFTLSFANTQLPGITITLPASETGTSGTTVTLPTMSGEYESGGKTWTPSAWDIGAFGSTYTITGDTVAHLIFEEVPSELTAYFTSAGAAETQDTFITNSLSVTLRDSSGIPIPYDPSKTYTKILLYKFDGTEMPPAGVTALDSDQGWCDTVLKVRANGNKYVYKLTYTVA